MDLTALNLKGITLIEDCAQTIGLTVGGRPVGSRGDLAVCSFYATKLMTTGEGGMILGRSESLMARIRASRQYDEHETLEAAFNYKMTEMQAAMGLCQLERLGSFLARRRAIATRYADLVPDAGTRERIFGRIAAEHERTVAHLLAISRSEEREHAAEILSEAKDLGRDKIWGRSSIGKSTGLLS